MSRDVRATSRPEQNEDSPGAGPLHRPRLLRRLKAALHTGHVLISAPPGYGKTTLLRSLVAARPQTHYLVLTPADADLACLQARVTPLLDADATLLLDDLHLVADGPEVLAWLVERVRAATPRLVLSGRTIPLPLRLEHGATGPRVSALVADDLAFTQTESRAMLQARQSTDQLDAWHMRTHGWPLGLALLAQQPVGAEHDLAVPLAEADLFTYLAQVVTAGLPPSLQHFMERTAVALRFDDELAAHIIDNPDEATALRVEVQRRNLFLEPAEEPGWFRYHGLVREFLLRREPHELPRLAERVVAWFEARGDVPTAIEQALLAGMQERAVRLIEGIAALFVTRTGRLRTFQRWIDQLDASTHARFPLLLTRLGLDYANFSLFDQARTWLDTGIAMAERSDDYTYARARLDLAAYLVHHEENAAATLALITPLLEMPDLSSGARRTALKVMAVALQFQGRYRQSAHLLWTALAVPETPDGPSDSVLYQNLFVAALEQGQWVEAERMLREYELRAAGNPIRRLRVLRSWGWLHEEMGDWDALERVIVTAEELNARLEETGAHQFEWSRLRALLLIGRGELDAGAVLLQTNVSPDAESSQINWHTYQAWIARRRGQPTRAVAIADEALARPGAVPQARAILALEGDIAAWEAGIERPLSPETLMLIRLRIRSHLLRLRALLALRCRQAGDRRWRHHLAQALRGLLLPEYQLLLTARDPELGKRFWTLLLVTDMATSQALAALRKLGDPQPVAELLNDPDPDTRIRAVQAIVAIGRSEAIPALAGALDAERDQRVAAAIEAALHALERLPPPVLLIQLMGDFEVRRGGVALPPSVWPRPIVRRLLQYFALHRSVTLPRDRILDDLWPEVEPDSAWMTFRTVYSRLRNVLEPTVRPKAPGRYFAVEGDSYRFDPYNRVRIDAETFEQTVRAALADAEQHDVPPLLAGLLVALDGWAPLLPNLPYEEWILAPREHLHSLYVEGCLYVAQAQLVCNQSRDAITWAERAVTAAPWLEEGYHVLMRAHARLGQRSLALKSYADAVRALKREVDVLPSALTLWLAERLERGEDI